MKRFRFFAKEIACDTYIPEPELSINKAGIYLYGFPGSIGVNAVTNFYLNIGYTVIQPHFPGTYDSGGEFTLDSSIKMMKTISDEISNGQVENVKKVSPISIPPQIEVCIGHSFGCFVALRSVKNLKSLKTLILLAPAITYGNGELSCGLAEDGESHINYVLRSRPHTYRMAEIDKWKNLYLGKYDSSPLQHSEILENVIGVVGTEDKYFNTDILRQNFAKIIESQVGKINNIKFEFVENSGHGSEGLLNEKTTLILKSLIA